jgi:hypothetical protein
MSVHYQVIFAQAQQAPGFTSLQMQDSMLLPIAMQLPIYNTTWRAL